MSTQSGQNQTYTIRETARLTGLAESNLRYYETIGLIPAITRDNSSKYRLYSESDIDYIISIACLSATGMSIEAMQEYLNNSDRGEDAAVEQIALLDKQSNRLKNEEKSLELRQQYLKTKADYWRAVVAHDDKTAEGCKILSVALAKQVKEVDSKLNSKS